MDGGPGGGRRFSGVSGGCPPVSGHLNMSLGSISVLTDAGSTAPDAQPKARSFVRRSVQNVLGAGERARGLHARSGSVDTDSVQLASTLPKMPRSATLDDAPHTEPGDSLANTCPSGALTRRRESAFDDGYADLLLLSGVAWQAAGASGAVGEKGSYIDNTSFGGLGDTAKDRTGRDGTDKKRSQGKVYQAMVAEIGQSPAEAGGHGSNASPLSSSSASPSHVVGDKQRSGGFLASITRIIKGKDKDKPKADAAGSAASEYEKAWADQPPESTDSPTPHGTAKRHSKRRGSQLSQCGTAGPADRESKVLRMYRYYVDQTELELDQPAMTSLLQTLQSVASTIPGMHPTVYEVELAEKVLIKILSDSYSRHLKDGTMCSVRFTTHIALSMLRDLVSSPYICVRKTAFNLVFNLSIHINILNNQMFFDGADEETISTGNAAAQHVGTIHAELVVLLTEMILQLVQWDEEAQAVWVVAYTAWVAMTGHPTTGFPETRYIEMIDIRALKRFAELPCVQMDASLHTKLVTCVYMSLMLADSSESYEDFSTNEPPSPRPQSEAIPMSTATAAATHSPSSVDHLDDTHLTHPQHLSSTPEHVGRGLLGVCSPDGGIGAGSGSFHTRENSLGSTSAAYNPAMNSSFGFGRSQRSFSPSPSGPATATANKYLNSSRLAVFGGWRAVVDLYLAVYSWSGREQCFKVLYYYVVEQIDASGGLRSLVPPEQERQVIDSVLNELLKVDLHFVLPSLLKKPTEFYAQLLRYVRSGGPLREGYSKQVATHVLRHLQGLATEYHTLPQVIKDDIKKTVELNHSAAVSSGAVASLLASTASKTSKEKAKETSLIELSLRQLRSLSLSNTECYQVNTENRSLSVKWIHALMESYALEGGSGASSYSFVSKAADGPASESPSPGQSPAPVPLPPDMIEEGLTQVFKDLTQSRVSDVRMMYLHVTQAYVLFVCCYYVSDHSHSPPRTGEEPCRRRRCHVCAQRSHQPDCYAGRNRPSGMVLLRTLPPSHTRACRYFCALSTL